MEVVFVDQYFVQFFYDVMQLSGDSFICKIILIGEGDGFCDIWYEDFLVDVEFNMLLELDEDDEVVLMYMGGMIGFFKGVVQIQCVEMLNCYYVEFVIGVFYLGMVVFI